MGKGSQGSQLTHTVRATGCLGVYFPLGARHRVPGRVEGSHVAWTVKSGTLSTSFLVFCYFDVEPPAWSMGRGEREEGL